ncbi:MAG TPA: hypothetical protein VI160_11895 [Gemmatimonadales bacterium]
MRSTIGCVLFLLAAGAVPAPAQGTFFIEGGPVSASGASDLQLGFRASRARFSGAGIDFALATIPSGFSQGIVLLMPDLDADLRTRLGDRSAFCVRLGGSSLIGFSGGGSGSGFGFNGGVGFVSRVGSSVALRVDFTYRELFSNGTSLGMSSLTFGLGIGG